MRSIIQLNCISLCLSHYFHYSINSLRQLHFNQSSSLNLVKFLQELIESSQIVELLLDLLPKALIQQLLLSCLAHEGSGRQGLRNACTLALLQAAFRSPSQESPAQLQANDPTTTLDDVDEGVDHHLAQPQLSLLDNVEEASHASIREEDGNQALVFRIMNRYEIEESYSTLLGFKQHHHSFEQLFIIGLKLLNESVMAYQYMIIALLGILAVVSACPAKQYYNASLADCAPCDPSCSACSALFRCSECQSGYYLQAEACWPCQTACKTCVRTEYCTSCDSGFYFANASSTCQLCSSNCLLCTPNDCLKCNPGFYPEGSACLTCKVSCECSDGTLRNCPDSFGGTSLLVAIILAPILAVITIALLFCLRKKICKQEETREIPTEASEQSLSHGLKLIGALLIMQNSSWKLNSQGKAKGLEETCSICLHGEVDLLTTCNHSFHAKCLRVWLLNNRSCPMCKRPCAKQMRKYCKQCKHNYILCTASSLAKFCTSIFAVCAYCQRTIEPTQTQTDT